MEGNSDKDILVTNHDGANAGSAITVREYAVTGRRTVCSRQKQQEPAEATNEEAQKSATSATRKVTWKTIDGRNTQVRQWIGSRKNGRK